MSTTARQGDSSTPMPHAGAGDAEQISAAAVTEVINDLDKRARAVYEAVRAAIAAHGYPPSLREIGEQVGYPDVAQFSKCFKKQFGYSPKQLQNASGRLEP